jgi:hypothetical protein
MPELKAGKGSRARIEILDQVIAALETIRDEKLTERPERAYELLNQGWTFTPDAQYGDRLSKPIPYGRGQYRVSLIKQYGKWFIDFREWWSTE